MLFCLINFETNNSAFLVFIFLIFEANFHFSQYKIKIPGPRQNGGPGTALLLN